MTPRACWGSRPSVGDRLCKMYPPPVMGRDYNIETALELSPDLRDAYSKEPEAKEIVDTARALEGLRREDSVHAAGVVIGDKPLVNYLPLKLAKDSRDDSKRIVTQFDMHGVEELGLLKMDFLGLRNLSVIEDTLGHLRRRGVELDIDHVPLDDDVTFKMLQRAETTGVFQMESSGMRNLVKLLVPDRFEDLMALVALYRPGPLNNGLHTEYAERKHGRRKVTYPHPSLEPVLADTYGVMIYQEQIMQIAVIVAGYSMGQADTLRKVMAKKKRELVGAEREKFVAGCREQGHPDALGKELFDLIEPFADYGFPAAHACAYGFIAYQTAYLMAHHPVEYMSAVLTSVKDDKDAKPFYLYACRGMGLRVLPPDVNESQMDFAPAPGEEPSIRYGLSAVRNVGQGAVQQILDGRDGKGAFTSFADFCRKVDPSVLSKRVLEALILAGAFDSLGYARRALLESQEKVSAPIAAERKAEAAGQFSLFGGGGGDAGVGAIDESVLQGEEFDKRTLLRFEKEMLGQFVTDHPLLEVRDALAAQTTHEIGDLVNLGDGDLVTLGGIIGGVSRKYTKRGEVYAQFRLEGLAAGVDILAFPNVYEAVPGLIETDQIVLVTGRIDLRGRDMQIRSNEVREPDLGIDAPARPGRGVARRRPAGGGVHERGHHAAPRAAGRASRRRGRARAVPRVHRRDAARRGQLPREPHGVAARRAAGPARLRRSADGARGPRLGVAGRRRRKVEAVFELIPAIDVSGGRLARLTARGPVPVEAFGGDPLAAGAAFVGRRRHAAARRRPGSGRRGLGAEPRRRRGPRRSGRSPPGERGRRRRVRGRAPARRRRRPGGARVRRRSPITPSSRSSSSGSAPRLAIGVETDGERIRSRGRRAVDLPLAETLGWLAGTAAERFVVTGVPRVGGLAGPDLDGLRAVLALRRPTIGAGGIASLDDVLAMRDAGAEGAIVGRAALEGSLEPAAVLRALDAAEDAGPDASVDGRGGVERTPARLGAPHGLPHRPRRRDPPRSGAPPPRRRRAARARRRPAAAARSGRGAPLARRPPSSPR